MASTCKPLRLFAGAIPDARAALRGLIARRPTSIETLQWELSRGMVPVPIDAGRFASTARPLKGMTAALVAASRPQSVEGALLLLERWVLSKLGLRDDQLAASHSKEGARVHALVACVAVHLGLCPASAVARHFHRAKATLSERIAACRRSSEDRPILSMPLGRIVEEAIALQAGLARIPQQTEVTPRPRTTH